MKKLFSGLLTPINQEHWIADFVFAIIRVLCGLLLAIDFGASKFGMPWSPQEKQLGLFEVVAWFPEDVAKFGGVFAVFPVFFAWMGAFSEAVGGIFLVLGLKTRVFFYRLHYVGGHFFSEMGTRYLGNASCFRFPLGFSLYPIFWFWPFWT